ncbi:HAMP domain-containing sensor histidine kinase [Paenibacillus filicis]|uniref:histidine kinase n=1 Tax=Paenibacillus gyeongsangnamensis TaxID=3388067 RepID=A0ABT4Q9K8_9BACL|nr:HAMP domain-containing sensor histidine kinase [Paenibacillus filicis]MCZ8513511.1 HAMP domain-containing sensor histidine kinase [Paenibacillus filicis]
MLCGGAKKPAMDTWENGLRYLRQNKDTIMQTWADMLIEAFPDQYSKTELIRSAELYFQFTTDLDQPAESHPVLDLLPRWCSHLVERETPLSHLVRSSCCWRQAMHQVLRQSGPDESPDLSLWMAADRRIDMFLELVCQGYNELSSSKLIDKEKALNQLHDDRLNLIGKMAASMAHEIRNPLTSIKGFLKLVGEQLPEGTSGKVRTYLRLIENEFENIHMQITGFLSFSKRRVIEEPRVTMASKHLLESVISLLNPRLLSENVRLSLLIGEDVGLSVQKVAVQQVIANIINNGLDALLPVKYEKEMNIHAFRDEERYIIDISNNGPSIPPEIRQKLFEPFVTDKEEGTGLGLAICKTIMHKNGGEIAFHTSPERTSFQLSFEIEPT